MDMNSNMTDAIHSIIAVWTDLALWVLVFFVVFTALSKLFPCNQQPILREEIATDLLYCFIIPLLSRIVRILFVGAGVFFIFRGESDDAIRIYVLNGYGPLTELPIWLQTAVIFLISDFILYWTHRWFHTGKLWNYHAIHHSPKTVDWLSTFRFHPINVWCTFTLLDAALLIAGFSPAAVALLAGFNLGYSAMVHANLNWTFGPFKYIFASPVFHRWHHTAQAEGIDKNFAPTFPLLDVIFGTFYMPEGRVPEKYGVSGSKIPSGFMQQIIWSFKQK